jgi:hypothetical protein
MSPKWICECSNVDCREEFSLETREYVRCSKHGQYLVLPGHEDPQDTIMGAFKGVVMVKPAAHND